MKKRTTEEFIELARQVHGDKYDYSKTVYVNKRSKVIITCPIHGDFEQNAHSHLNGRGCPKCGVRKSSKTRLTKTEKFIEKCRQKHGDKYSYDKVVFTKSRDKVIITCPIHGDFKKRPDCLMDGGKCPQCSKTIHTTEEEFIKKANYVHNNFFIYDNCNFKNVNSEVKVTCPIHGEWFPKANNHLSGMNCPQCSKEGIKHEITLLKPKNNSTTRYTTETFIEKSNKVHNNEYSYDKTIYEKNNKKVIVTCSIHGDFEITPNHHLGGRGCPKCAGKIKLTKEQFIKQN